jgi:predicted component of type VI protein secretion system
MDRLQWSQHHAAPKAYAFLAPVAGVDSADTIPPIPLTFDEISLGSNPSQASLVLNDASVEGRHACLTRQEDGSFRLADEGSIAGTWVNYTPVSKEGTRLEHGDLVHIGRVGFRFTIRKPTQVRKPIVVVEPVANETSQEPYEEKQE